MSDYRFRGLSLSDRDPALQGGVDLALASGIFVGAWASTIARYAGSKTEVDVYAGYAGSVATFDYTAGAYAYLYPGGHGANYVELQADVTKEFGPAKIGAEIAYVPDQKNTGSDNTYLGGKAEVAIPGSPLSLFARGGFEDGFYSEKLDWEAGVKAAGGPLSASLSVVGSNFGGATEADRLGRTGILASLIATF